VSVAATASFGFGVGSFGSASLLESSAIAASKPETCTRQGCSGSGCGQAIESVTFADSIHKLSKAVIAKPTETV
jgi:hypothetical protein